MKPSDARHCICLALLLAALWAPARTGAEPAAPDAVEELRRALQSSGQGPAQRDAALAKAREGLQGVAEMARGLLLKEWRHQDPDDRIASIDARHRAALRRRWDKEMRAVLAEGSRVEQASGAELVARVGLTERSAGSRDGIAAALATDLARLLREGSPEVREAAARALGQINPEPEVAVPELARLLQTGLTAERVTAAEALVTLVEGTAQLTAGARDARDVHQRCAMVARVGEAVVPVLGRGLEDAVPEVRRWCLAGLAQAAQALRRLLLEDNTRGPSAAEEAELMPFLIALRDQGPGLAAHLKDSDARVHSLALSALSEMAQLRLRLRRRGGADPLLEGLTPAIGPLAQELANPDAHAQLQTLDVLEALGTAAAPAVPALVRSVNHPNRFVRWSAARVLGKIGPEAAPLAVPALVRALDDSDIDLGLAAVAALQRYGSSAADAIPALVRVAAPRHPMEVRLAAVAALEAIGQSDTGPVLAALCAALADPDARLRQHAAESLGRLRPHSRSVLDALSQVRNDSSPEVRKAAGEALLNLPPAAEIQPVSHQPR